MSVQKQTLTPADFCAPTQSRFSSSGVTSTSSLFSGFLSGCFPPPWLLVEFVTLFSGRSFLRDMVGAALIRRVPTISCPSCRLTACSLLRTGRRCSQARGRVASAWFLLSLMDVRRGVHLLWILSSWNRIRYLVLHGTLPDDEPQNVAKIFSFGETLTCPTKDIWTRCWGFNSRESVKITQHW